ncbi:hypothetical protein [Novosphingobium sp. TH158]|uniref:hypothetical protein n=1 Tax=Novosphingobium sp. TH158 TaxID=2067455 RepID=UPI000C7CB59F|nr:hypothetical protein [Novosphingobium sp. TH158]PLK25600.1 hypothetical protein C0V78_00845 [Novosphingobium sp. TH158]
MVRVFGQVALFAGFALHGAVAMAQPVDSADPARHDFSIGTQNLTLPVPAGYCKPSGLSAEVARQTALADEQNITLATFYRCNQAGTISAEEYVLIKVPKMFMSVEREKQSALAALSEVMTAPNAPKFDGPAQREAEKGISKVIGSEAKIGGQMGYMGTDADCVYIGGTVTVSAAQGSVNGAWTGCMTVAAKRMFAVYVYDFRAKPAFEDLKTKAGLIAASVRAL